MAEQGYIVISDITGYTAFLSESELDHAEDSLRSLLEVLIQQAEPPLIISRLEGDAVISYAPTVSLLQGQTLVEMLENTYVAFRQARERMKLNTTCTCKACQNIPNLDLKFLVHHGSFIVQDLGSHKELVGSDVNLAHRLLKNRIVETTGIVAYAAYTEAAVDTLGIREFCDEMTPHVESYEHLGEVQLHVQDMQAMWERERVKGGFIDLGPAGTQEGLEALRNRILQDLENGDVISAEPGRVSEDQVAAAVEASLSG